MNINIEELCGWFGITENQAKGLINEIVKTYNDVELSIKDFQELKKKGLITSNGVDKGTLKTIVNKYPKLGTHITMEKIVDKASKITLPMGGELGVTKQEFDKVTNSKNTIGEPIITPEVKAIVIGLKEKLIINDREMTPVQFKQVEKKILDLCTKLGGTKPAIYYYIWVHCFPTSSGSNNKKWEEFFGVRYTSAAHIRIVGNCLKEFMKVYQTKDIGLFILGTVWHIRKCISEDNRVFVHSMKNFMDIYAESAYEYMEQLAEKGDFSEVLEVKFNDDSTTGTVRYD